MTGLGAVDVSGNPSLPRSARKGGAATCAPAIRLTLGLLRLYKRWISPAFPPSCRYVPTCSEYAMEAVERHGVVGGGLMAGWRLLRCHPLAKGGYDPVDNCRASLGMDGRGACPHTTELTDDCRASLGWTGEGARPHTTQ